MARGARLGVAGLVVLAGLVGAGCGSGDGTDGQRRGAEPSGPPSSGDPLQFEIMDRFDVSRAEAGCMISWLEDYAGSFEGVAELVDTEMGDNAYLDCAFDPGAGADPGGGDPGGAGEVFVVREYCRVRESGMTIGGRTQYSVEYWAEYSNGMDEIVSMDTTETPPAC